MSSLSFTDLIIVGQLALEAVLVILVLVLLRRGRQLEPRDPAQMPEKLRSSIETFLAESEKIAAVFEQNLKDKKNLSADLILKLDRRLSDYRNLLRQSEASYEVAKKKLEELRKMVDVPRVEPPAAGEGKANPAAPEVRALVLQMAKKGHSPEEIAAKAHLHLGEVELIIDLERQFSV